MHIPTHVHCECLMLEGARVSLAMPLLEIHPCVLFQERLLLQFGSGGKTTCTVKIAALDVCVLCLIIVPSTERAHTVCQNPALRV